MPVLKTYDLFLSHAWGHNIHYYKLEEMLRQTPYFKWRNYSVPIHDPLINPNHPVGKSRLLGMLENQVRPVNCVLIIGGMYATYSEWIMKEIEIAQYYKKPIVGIYPWGQQRMPLVVQNAAHEIVGWNSQSIVGAIRRISL
ncbi:MAG: nuclease [Bacteroidetes bacterium]|nr:MAG: nuclease [Bacteroidota bacterium]